MIKVEYTYEGGSVSDYSARDIAVSIAKHGKSEYIWQFSTSNIFEHLRVLVKQGVISHEELVFIFEDQEILVNKNGTINHWPKGFLDWYMDVLTEIIGD